MTGVTDSFLTVDLARIHCNPSNSFYKCDDIIEEGRPVVQQIQVIAWQAPSTAALDGDVFTRYCIKDTGLHGIPWWAGLAFQALWPKLSIS